MFKTENILDTRQSYDRRLSISADLAFLLLGDITLEMKMIDNAQFNVSTPIYSAETPLNDKEYFILWGISSCTFLLSCFGSFSIILISRRKFRDSVYHRLLFLISAIDLVTSVWVIFNPILMNETGYRLSMGNQATCTAVGFAILMSIISKAFYSFYIALYFMLSVRYTWSDKRIIR